MLSEAERRQVLVEWNATAQVATRYGDQVAVEPGNTRVYLLESSGQPVPVNVTGELFIGGDSVARGSVEQPALTAERFVPDAFSGVPGARLYRTGDLARWRHDGVLEFLGRADAPVKVRGYRIGLAEGEAALASTADFVAPRTPTEEKLTELFTEVLRLRRVSVTGSFFELGGHSLLATQLISRIRSTFEVELPLRALFEAPTAAALAARIESARQSTSGPRAPAIVPVPRTDALPLSFAQQRLWFTDQLEPGNASYNMPTFVRMEGQLDVGALRHAFDELVRRHEALRTTFVQHEGEPVQHVSPTGTLPLDTPDLSALEPQAAREELERHLRADMLRPFDLTTGPLLRAQLLKLSPTEHVLSLNMHHIVSDGWSLGVLVREVAALYDAFSQGRPSPLPPLSIQYPDYAVWQRQWLQGAVLDEQLGWWRRQLSGRTTLELPTDKPRPPVQTFRGAQVPVALSPSTSEALKALCQQEGATPFMALLAAFQVLLSRYSGQQDVSVGSPIAGRQRGETEGLIGFFVNTLVLRSQVDPNTSFFHLLRQVRETALGAYAHQDVPFERLVEELQSTRDLSRGPLFQVLFALQNTFMPSLDMNGLKLRPLEVDNPSARFELELNLGETAKGVQGSLTYNTDLFNSATANRLAEHFRVLVEALVARPEVPLASVSMLSEEERRKVLVEWNATATEYPRASTLPEVFSQVVARYDNKVAVESGEENLTYRQLDARANQLAWHLRGLGVATDSRVAIALDRSLELIVSLVAILKAGGAYVPLDPSYPRERLAAMVEDARPGVLITSRALLAKLPGEGLSTVVLDEVSLAGQPTSTPPVAALPQSLAYIDFTSGSTGRPKGVGTPQAAVLRTVFGNDYAHLGPDETFLLIAPVSFDASTLELWGPLLHGARLVVFPPHSPSDLKELESVLVKHGVTTLHLTAGLFTQVVDNNFQALRNVKQLLTGGDVVSAPHVRRVLEELRIPVTACYGPTETTLFASTHRMTDVAQVGTAVPIGKPMGNTCVYLLDVSGQPVPVGVVGELFIGGDGVARGYVEQPALTAERFVPDAFSGVPGARLYRTGDLARWRPDGVLGFLGRADAQVKVRGYRIELAEVEAALLAFPDVAQAVALVREDVPGDKRLVGYVAAPESLDTAALRSALKQRLPEYMVPSALVRLDALPLTANAKVDRKALPAPNSNAASRGETYVAPRTPTEQRLAELFSQVLRVQRVGVQDDFFELGGHSLLATQVISRIRATLGVELPLRALFEAPSVAALAARVETPVSSRALQAPSLLPVSRSGPLPLSFAQQRLWFIDQLDPGGTAYNMPTVLRLHGPLDVPALEKSFTALVERHESLRTSFGVLDGEPVQVIGSQARFPLSVVNLSALPAEEREAEALRQTRLETQRPFDLARGPVFRALLLRLGAQDHVLIGTMHHIVSDGWSMGVMVRELAELYAAHSLGREARLPALPVQYADFAAWQRSWLRGESLEKQLGYWREQLSGAAPVLELPTDRPRPSVQSSRGAWLPVHLSRELTERLMALCQQEGTTPFMALLAVWQVLLSRYSGQDDISVGSPIAGRTRAETEGLIGFFVNTLVLRTQLDARATFRELLSKVRATTLGAYEHQDVPFEKLVEELQPQRSISHSPLFQVMLVLQNTPVASLEVAGVPGGAAPLRMQPVDVELQAVKFDLTLSLAQTPDGLSGTLSYRTDLFERSTISRMAEHLATLLESAVSSPGSRVGELPLLRDTERHQVLEAFNASPAPFVAEGPLHALIEAQAARHPSRPAVACEGLVLTYGELDRRANQLAWHLRSLGVGPETCVALCLERSVDTVVALLGIWKAGGAYVPLDPAQPALRLRTLVEEVLAPVVVTQSRNADAFVGASVQPVLLDTQAEQLAAGRVDAPPCEVSADHLAYVLFTSGSTGRPKGVAVAHGQLVHYVRAATERLGLADCDSFALVSTFVADLGNTVLFPALCTGGLLHVLTQERASSPEGVAEYFQRHAVECVKLVPSHLSALLTAAEPRHVLPRKKLVLGGESSTWALMEQVRALAPDCEVFNHYGPTETTVGVLAGPVETPAPGSAPVAVPLGRPLDCSRLYVLDAAFQPVPVGVPGELYIGGAQVTRGYLHRPELTAERYLPDPYSPVPGARMYRSGDRVRWREDGRVEFIGRADFQVKVRGFRVEPGEVATVLREHPEVRDAVVLAREDVPGDKRLVAYVSPTLDVSGLRAWMRERLPEHMVPSAFVPLEALPLTPNGKVDRKALPAPVMSTDASATFVAPRTPTETQLAAIWAEVLHLETVGATDDFFNLGGHSLLATQVVSRVRRAFGVELPVRALFEATTLATLASRVESARPSHAAEQLPPLVSVPRTGPLPLSFSQQRVWFLDQLQPGSAFYNIPFAVSIDGPLHREALTRTLQELVRRHEVLRTSFHTLEDGEPFQRVHPDAELTLSFVDLGQLPESQLDEAARREALAEAQKPFDLKQAPLLRATLVRLTDERHVLLVTVHHIVSDGWTSGILLREVGVLYPVFVRGLPSPLPPLPFQYADYAAWQRGWLRDETLERQVAWWRHQLHGVPHALELPTDRPRPPVQTDRGATVPVRLGATLTATFKQWCEREGVTPFMGLLAVWQVLLSRYSGQDDIVVGSPIANRQHTELEGIVGFFVNTLALRGRLAPGMSLRELLAQVKETTLGAYAHQDVPFEKLVDALKLERDLSRTPLFQVMLGLTNTPHQRTPEADGDGAGVVRPLEVDSGTSKFDLALLLADLEDGISGWLEYSTDLFDEATARRMGSHLVRLLESAVADAGQPISRLKLLGEDEQRQVLVDFNDTSRAPYTPVLVHRPVEAQARRTPQAVAVSDGTRSFTYAELDARANQVAHYLVELGVPAGGTVGICLDKSLDMAVAVLATLKAGAAYLPLDPSYPADRLAFMLEDAQAPVLLTQSHLLSAVPANTGALRVCLDTEAELLSRQPSHAPDRDVSPESNCYFIYTSGSTGRPKGIVMPHRAISSLLAWQNPRSVVRPEGVTLQFASLNFDVSLQELFGAWWCGGSVLLPTGGLRQDIPALLEFMDTHAVERLFLPFVALQAMADAVSHGAPVPHALVEVVTAGEQLQVTPALVAFFEKLPGCILENQYGPSEAHVVSAYRLEGLPSAWPKLPCIGAPVGHTQLYVLDAHGQPCPVGVPGEVFVGGTHLAHGYLARPDLTAKAFVPDPFSTEPGARLYRTGDAAKWRTDGTLEFLGRLDGQVKLRGYRVEPGEVESVLRAAPGVRDAAAVVREVVAGDKRLVAYVVAEGAVDAEALRGFLQQRLPEYMMPSAFVMMEALPLTPSGKLARNLLPAPDAESLRGDAPFTAPRNPLEEKLAELFSTILRLPQVSITDSFFELGGHSLLATQVISRIRSQLGVELPLRVLFEAPTVERLAARIESARQSASGTRAPAIVPVPRTGPLPLSFAQQRLWFIDQLQPGSASYNMPTFVRMEGVLDVAALQRSFEELVRRHEALRTTFTQQEGQPLQLITPTGRLPLEVTDLSGLGPVAGRTELERRLREELLTPFHLSTGPLIRARLLKLGATDHVLALNMHHIVSDGWSMGVLVREVAALYDAFSQGRPSPLPPLPLQYADFAVWQREWLQGAVLDEQIAYWKQHLSGAATLELPTDKPRPPVQTFHGGTVPVELSLEVSHRLDALCQQEGATPFMALTAAFQVLLSRYSGQQDISVGSPIAGRNRGELEGLIGFFVNTLVLRTQLDARHSFRDVLRQVKEAALGAYAHQDVPFERLVEELQRTRDMSRSPLFQVFFALQNTPMPQGQGQKTALTLRPVERVDNPTIKFELQLSLTETPNGYQGSLGYNTDLFESTTAQRMVEHFRVLVEALVTQPRAPLASLSMLTQAERQQVLVEWNATASEYPRGSTLPEVFSQVVARYGDKVAVESGEEKLTYRQLDERANQLAWHLRGLGVSTDSRVALALDRSLELIVSLVAILKAGGAYVPLDPSYPRERLSAMVEDARPGVLITSRELLAKLPTEGLSTVVPGEVSLEGQPTSALPVAALPQSLAYIDFTSGSTGRPKGVGTPQAAVLRTLFGNDYAHLGPEETFLLIAPVSFDASTLELWGPLLHGARLVVFPPHSPSDLKELESVLVKHGVTTLHLTAGLFTQVVDNQPSALRHVKQLLTGGDVVSAPHVRRVLEGMFIPVTACYGPTETTLFASTHRMTSVEHVGTSVPIGKPLGNTRIYLLDASSQPVPVGVVGELFIGGDGVARGYVGQPALTAERFVPDSFSSVPGARLYRTGDLARWRNDGVLEFLGRADAQVKVRGYRIELAEVEAALLAFPDVAQAVALVREDVPGDKRLVGYVAAPESLDTATLRASLKQRLPEYMVPSSLVRLDSLPLTANAKLDRKALPPPDAGVSTEALVAPRTPTEEKLAELFAAVLRVQKVSVAGNFFELGGHSLLATQLVSRIRATFGVELPLRALFEASTVAALATRIESASGPQAPAIVPVPRTGPLLLSFAQQRLWFIDQLQPGSASYNMPTFVRMDGPLDTAALQRAFEELVHRHEALRTSFTQQEGQPLQLIASLGALPLDVTDLSGLEPSAARAELERRLREELLTPFNLSSGPLMRARLLKLGPTDHVLALNMHHIVSDGWSMGVLVREVSALYDAFVQGRPSPLPPLPIQYADYATWQRQWLQGEVLEAQLDWWRKQLSGLSTLELPTDKPRPPVQTFRGAHVPVALSQAASEKLKALCQQEGLTPFMALLAAFQVLLSRYSGQQDISVGSPIAGRQRGELEGLIGFFVNTLVMRAQVDDRSSFLHLLRRVKETALGAYAHQDVPFERLVEELQPARDMSRSPLFQVIFALQNAPTVASMQGPEQARKPALALRPLDEVNNPTVRFELELSLSETSEGFQGPLRYNTDLFEPATAARMAEHFQILVEALVTRADAPLASISLLTETERKQVLVDWNATASEYPRGSTLPEVFSQVVARYGDKVAVEFGEEKLTYRQLDARASQLAHHLRGLGVSTDSRVAIVLDRSLELIVSLVAILKAGGAYVPLDPSYPRERLNSMVEDSRPRVLVTSREMLPKLSTKGLVTLLLEDVPVEEQAVHAPPSTACSESLAYIDFTSGSTGRPKGVGTTHRNILRTLLGVDFAHFGPEETLLQLAPISFDASTLEVWGALLHGARLVVMPPQPPSLEQLEQVLRDARVTTLWLTAGLFTQVVDSHLQALRPLKQLLAGGDVVPPAHARRVLEELGIPLTNGYGPTETTVFAACFRMTDPAHVGASVPIGRPIGSTRVFLLDASGQPVPVGVVGELFIGGDGVARGYVGQPALTAERFVPDSFSSVPGARLYRSGDLARWRTDGVLEFLGRADAQVKVRGYRIELAEVEAALLAFPDVAQAVALVREDVPGDRRLVGYVAAPESLDTATLRASLKQRLPEYMVPSSLVRLDSLPLTANAKLDRKALPAPDASTTSAAYVAPRTPTEEAVAAVWAEVLHVENVGATDDFFSLGGHSLLAVRLMARLRERIGVALPVSALFQGATVERLARRLEQRDDSPTSNLVRLDSGTATGRPLFLVHGGGGSVLGYTELVRLLGNHRPIYGLSASGIDGGELSAASIEVLARDYLAQLRAVQPQGPYLLGGWSFGGIVAYEMARLLQQAGEQVELLALLDSLAPEVQPRPEPDALMQLAGFGRVLGLPWQELPLDVEHLRRLDVRGALAYVLELARRSPSGGPALDLDAAERLFRVYQRLSHAQRTYVPAGAYKGPALLLRAATPPSGVPRTQDLGWSAWLDGTLTVYDVPGDHYTLLSAPNAPRVAERLVNHLDSLERDAS
ncbi:non-ribosomal peptide synthase/polyketide synthase [Pyxidicoccus sp. MSG2]|nr:non-ribosomal peptide synthetase [Pyxidicoccus sp. MSG2]MCY1015594.1 non-ribosomal peptide synthase/polyketide synthase [Pyxidicoccus sp. MSG2]